MLEQGGLGTLPMVPLTDMERKALPCVIQLLRGVRETRESTIPSVERLKRLAERLLDVTS